MGEIVGYARVSTKDQNLDLQIKALENAGCTKIFHDIISGTKTNRPGLDEALEFLSTGDVFVVWKLDRMGRSLQHLTKIINDFNSRGIEFRCLTFPIDTTSSGGKLVYSIFAAVAEFERDLMAERTAAGLDAAREKGAKIGRPKVLDKRKIRDICRLFVREKVSMNKLAQQYSVSRTTIRNILKSKKIIASP